jgi:hypothetical protein
MPHRFTIGRDRASDIAIADDSVSRTHAEIWLEDDGTLMLADHGSSNGTELVRAGETSALSKAALLRGDEVRFGAVTLGVKDLIDAIEAKSPGALTRPPQAAPMQKATTPPPIPDRPQAPPPIAAPPPPPPIAPLAPPQAQVQSPPPLPKPVAAPPPVPQVIPPIPGGQPMPPPVPPAPPERAVAPPPPPVPERPPAVHPVAPPLPERAVAPPPPPALAPPSPERAAGPPAIVRCECGAIKTQGQICPGCHR